MNHEAWPALPYVEWAPTKKTLHLVAQMLGKARLALAPPSPSGSRRISVSQPAEANPGYCS